MAELLIIADDLTGAIEAGVQLSKHNIPAVVVIDSNMNLKSELKNIYTTVLVVNTESRHSLPKEAAIKIAEVIHSVKNSGIKWFYKKTDSTMRGNIGSELDAFMNETNQPVLPYIPAHPKLKRYTRDGYQYVGDVLLHQTSFANDPYEPAKCSFVPDILKEQLENDIQLIEPGEISSEILFGEKKKIIVFNCNSESHLQTIGEIILKNGWQNATAGTAGFIEILPNLFPLKSSKINMESILGPMLFVNGSLNSTSLMQVNFAKESGLMTIFLTQNLISSSNFKTTEDYKQITKTIRTEFENARHVLISTSDLIHPKNKFESGEKNDQSFSKQTGKILTSIINEIRVTALCVFGGDTLMGIMKEAGGKYIETKNEILSGVAYSKASIRLGTINLLSKPGGYGEKDVVLKIINRIKHSGK